MLGPCWEYDPVWLGPPGTLNTSECPKDAVESSLSQILQDIVPSKYYLSRKACLGILRRSKERGKPLPPLLELALKIQAGLKTVKEFLSKKIGAFHINQRDEGIDLGDKSGALMATSNMQMQSFGTQPNEENAVGFNGYNGDLTGDVSATLGVNCGMSTGRNGLIQPIAFAANQRDEVRNLHDVAGALGAQPGMKQQTFIASAFSAGFLAESSATAGDIGYQEECAPTLKAGGKSGAVLCLNDQGGQQMDCSEDVAGTLRAQEHGHQPLVFENHGIDSRYTGPHTVSPTMSARYGTGGNNIPLVAGSSPPFPTTDHERLLVFGNHGTGSSYTGPHHVSPSVTASFGEGGNNVHFVAHEETICIMGNAIDRQPHNGGNGIGVSKEVAYTLTATDHHAVFSRMRTDAFRPDDVASTESARQGKDATDLILEDREPLEPYPQLIRRLTPLECERLQGYPDGWTDLPEASDTARYKALGNSVAIPCVEFLMLGISLALNCSDSRYALYFY